MNTTAPRSGCQPWQRAPQHTLQQASSGSPWAPMPPQMSLPAPVYRPPLVRPRPGRMLAGVTTGVADHLDLPVNAVRVGFVVLSFMGGAGLALYAWLWALVPGAAERSTTAAPGGVSWSSVPAPPPPPGFPAPPVSTDPATPRGRRSGRPSGRRTERVSGAAEGNSQQPARSGGPGWTGRRGDLIAGALLLVAGIVLLASRQGWAARPGIVVPLLVVGSGAIIAYAQLDEVERARWAARTGGGTRVAVLRMVGGLVLVILGLLLLVVQDSDLGQLGRTLLAAVAVLAGTGLVLAPWGVRMWRDLDTERAARIREAERADIAAHLHDSVLQTLALIQRRSSDSAEVTRLARAQERDLRGWLYTGAPDADPSTLAARVAATVAEVEDLQGVLVELVTVGDRPVDDRSAALLAALREAVTNAAQHSGAAVQVYVEAGPEGVEAFVKDRGTGFDLDDMPTDRHGVRESIIGRMERHGGSARIISTAGEGTEVRLLLPEPSEPGRERAPAVKDAQAIKEAQT